MTTTIHDTLHTLLRDIAIARAELSATKGVLAEKEAVFREANADLFDAKSTLEARIADRESQVKALAVAMYQATGEKKPADGVQVKLFTTLNYDKEKAFHWACETGIAVMPTALDVKAFEKIAKATVIPFVTITEEPRPSIDSDLSHLLEGDA